jgi:hypothetical protein
MPEASAFHSHCCENPYPEMLTFVFAYFISMARQVWFQHLLPREVFVFGA